jgi:hypothetical protein
VPDDPPSIILPSLRRPARGRASGLVAATGERDAPEPFGDTLVVGEILLYARLRQSGATGIEMDVSLEQAIEIHAKVLKFRHKHLAPRIAREHARDLKYWNDHDGHDVWLRVADVAESLLKDQSKLDEQSRRA